MERWVRLNRRTVERLWSHMDVRVGCCGFPLQRQKYYAAFPLVEVQDSFYQPPLTRTAARWRAEAPPSFEFSLKAWQLITHEPSSPTYRRLRQPIPPDRRDRYGAFRPTDEVQAAWARTVEVARALASRVIVFQCPPRFTPTDEHVGWLRRFFTGIDRGAFMLAWEPRGDWPGDLVAGLCADLGLVHVVDPLREAPRSAGLRYFRLHGVTGYRYLHTDEDLGAIADRLVLEAPSYVLFDNFFMGEDAKRLLALLARRAPPAFAAPRAGC
jgi:uncharacterized protein YecE (DUF72 family)